jgi:uncharacterized integral membrane protein
MAAAILIAFALSNRQEVMIGFWPLGDGMAVPLYLAMLFCLFTGLLLGWLLAGLRFWRRRRRERKAAAE